MGETENEQFSKDLASDKYLRIDPETDPSHSTHVNKHYSECDLTKSCNFGYQDDLQFIEIREGSAET